jgi:hypothetical protein
MQIGMYASFSEGVVTCKPVRLHSGKDRVSLLCRKVVQAEDGGRCTAPEVWMVLM